MWTAALQVCGTTHVGGKWHRAQAVCRAPVAKIRTVSSTPKPFPLLLVGDFSCVHRGGGSPSWNGPRRETRSKPTGSSPEAGGRGINDGGYAVRPMREPELATVCSLLADAVGVAWESHLQGSSARSLHPIAPANTVASRAPRPPFHSDSLSTSRAGVSGSIRTVRDMLVRSGPRPPAPSLSILQRLAPGDAPCTVCRRTYSAVASRCAMRAVRRGGPQAHAPSSTVDYHLVTFWYLPFMHRALP